MNDDESVASTEEALKTRKTWGQIRGLLRVALDRGAKDDYRQGCLAVLALIDDIDPVGKGCQVTRETFAPGKETEHA